MRARLLLMTALTIATGCGANPNGGGGGGVRQDISGDWTITFRLNDPQVGVRESTGTVDLDRDGRTISGEFTQPGLRADVTGTYDPQANRLILNIGPIIPTQEGVRMDLTANLTLDASGDSGTGPATAVITDRTSARRLAGTADIAGI